MNFPKICLLALCVTALPAYAVPTDAQRAPESHPVFAVSTDATTRTATALNMKPIAKAAQPAGRETKNQSKNKAPTAVIAFGITLLAAPESMGGAFSR